jgi:hypothetical protein
MSKQKSSLAVLAVAVIACSHAAAASGALAAGVASSGVAAGRAGSRLDPASPEDAVRLHQKVWCSLEEGKPALLWSQGSTYGRVPGEPDRKLFDFQIWNARACRNVHDPKRGIGYRSVSREVMLYIDPATQQLLRKWRNPYTGEIVDVIHTQNDPVNMAEPMFAYDEQGRPSARFQATFVGGRAIFANEAPLFYDNPLGGPFQEYVGGRYHAMEMLNVYVYESDLLDPRVLTLERWSRSWKRVSGFLPWMRMGDRPGSLLFTAVGQRVQSVQQLPQPIRDALQQEFAKYQSPPPLDDSRPNETSWTYFKRVFDQWRAQGTATRANTEASQVTAAAAVPVTAPGEGAVAIAVAEKSAPGPASYDVDLRRECAADPAAPLITWYQGRVYSRRAGEKDRHLFGLQRLRVSRCEIATDARRGRGYRTVARDLTIYVDRDSGEAIDTWRNPWNGSAVPVVHTALDGVAGPVRYERDADGRPAAGPSRFVLSDKLLIGSDAEARFTPNPLGGAFQDYVGGQLQILDYTTAESPVSLATGGLTGVNASSGREVRDVSRARRAPPGLTSRDTVLSWGQVAPWLPWMKMGSREGEIVVHAAGMQLDRIEQLPAVLRRALADERYARFARPPESVGPEAEAANAWSAFRAGSPRGQAEVPVAR